MGSLVSELKRRKVFRVTAAYLVGAWAILEFVSVVTPMLRLPEWAGPFVLMLLTIGFVAAVALSWTFEMTADGLRRTAPTVDTAAAPISKFDWALMAASVAIIALVSYQQIFALSQRAVEQRLSVAAPGGISIAVLPFVNLSGDPGQEFFSDGMTEEITSALAKVNALRVVGRTSAFKFKGQNEDLRAIGQALGANHLLEGSVRKSGNRVRITGQLIKADDGTHIWTENYDRELTDIFATQDDIARAIAGALQVPLGLKLGEALVSDRSADTDSYQDYLRAKALERQRVLGRASLAEPIGILERVVTRDPNYAPAWALLSRVYVNNPPYTGTLFQGRMDELKRLVDLDLSKAEAAARRAIALDVGSADGYAGLAFTMSTRGKLVEAEDNYKQALMLDAYNPYGLNGYASFLSSVGRVKEGLAIHRRLHSIDSLVPSFIHGMATSLMTVGENEAALTMYNSVPIGPQRATGTVHVYAAMGRYADAATVLANEGAGILPTGAAALGARLLHRAPHPPEDRDLPGLGQVDFVYVHVGLPERALDQMAREFEAGYRGSPPYVRAFTPSFAPVRKTPRFKELMLKSGRVDYWRARGWPDMCRPVGADDFECD